MLQAQARDTHLDTDVTFVGLLFLFRAGGLVKWSLIPGGGQKTLLFYVAFLGNTASLSSS
jgi:hypothetical protein